MSGTNHTPEVAAVASPKSKLLLFVAFALAAFAMSYSYAVAQSADGGGTDGGGLFAQGAGGGCGMSGGSSGGGGCGGCGGGGPAVEGTTTLEGDVQFIAVDTSTGMFTPNAIKAKAGVPIVIEYSQAPGGCLAGVSIPQFGVYEDLTGGAKRVELPALEAGTYDFYCQMQMISAQIVVE